METYDNSTRPTLLNVGDKVTFIGDGQKFSYQVCSEFLNKVSGGHPGLGNSAIFTVLGMKTDEAKYDFAALHYGPGPRGGDWPVAPGPNRMEKLTRLVNALFDLLENPSDGSKDYKARVIVKETVGKGLDLILSILKTEDKVPSASYIMEKLTRVGFQHGFTEESVGDILNLLAPVESPSDLHNFAVYIEAARTKAPIKVYTVCPDNLYLDLLKFCLEPKGGKAIREAFAVYEPNALQRIADKLRDAKILQVSQSGFSIAPDFIAPVQEWLQGVNLPTQDFTAAGFKEAKTEEYVKLG